MRLIFGLLSVAHRRWAAWETARCDFYRDEVELAFRRAETHRDASDTYALRAGFDLP